MTPFVLAMIAGEQVALAAARGHDRRAAIWADHVDPDTGKPDDFIASSHRRFAAQMRERAAEYRRLADQGELFAVLIRGGHVGRA